jgi:hypothetical protein
MVKLRKEMIGAIQTGTLFGNRVISGAVDLGFRPYMDGKLRHRPTTLFMIYIVQQLSLWMDKDINMHIWNIVIQAT